MEKYATGSKYTPGLEEIVHRTLRIKRKPSPRIYKTNDRLTKPSQARKDQGFTAIKMNGTDDLGWLDSPAALDDCVERLKAVKAMGMDAGIDFHGRVHKPMAKQLAKALEPHRPLFIEEPLLSEHLSGIRDLSRLVSSPIALGERLYSR